MKSLHLDPCTFISLQETWGFKSNLPTLKFIINFQELAKLKSSGNKNVMHHSKRTIREKIYQTVIILNMHYVCIYQLSLETEIRHLCVQLKYR